VSGAKAGALAAAAWAVAEPLLGRVVGTPYSDVRMLGRMATGGRAWPVAGVAVHVVNGALFGAAFERLGLHGVRHGVIAAEAENLALWPGFAVVDRLHPDRRNGSWPRLVTSPRVAVYEVATHALYGAVLGLATRR